MRYALRLAAANATVLAVIAAVVSRPGVDLLRAVVVGVVAVAASLVALVYAQDLARSGAPPRDCRRLVAWLTLLGVCALAAYPPGAGVLFAAFLTPVGTAALLGDWVAAAAATAALTVGLGAAVALPGGPGSSNAFSDAMPALAVIFGAVLPIRYALETIERSPEIVRELRGPAPKRPVSNTQSRALNDELLRQMIAHRLTVDEIVATHPRDRGQIERTIAQVDCELAVIDLVREGRTQREIADILGLTQNQVEYCEAQLRLRYRVRKRATLRLALQEEPPEQAP
jgi:DNA-binding NarL/FixJ family response regulator